MQITITDDAARLATLQATAAGFASVEHYIEDLIRYQANAESSMRRKDAFANINSLREELPKFSTEAIVELVRESRHDLQ